MLSKHPKPLYRRLLIKGAVVLFVVEAAGFVGCYGAWTKLNSDRDFRNTVHHKFPVILEAYYKIGETLGDSNIRQIDYEYWQKEGKLGPR